MPLEYYQHVRTEIAPLLPAKADRILEIGSGAGYTLKWLKSKFPQAETVAVEGFAEVEGQLAANVDRAIIHDLEKGLPDVGKFDLVLALDVLEHLRNPERVLEQLVPMMNPGATLIVSVPNVAHLSVSLPLLFGRRFEYADGGILDRTHVKFFVESSAVALLNDAGFEVTDGVVNGLISPRTKALDSLTLGVFRNHFAKQYIMKGQLKPKPFSQKTVAWKRALAPGVIAD